MKKVGNFFRIIFHALIVVLLVVTLVASVVVLSLRSNLNDRSTVKNWVDSAEVYDKITPNLLNLLEEAEGESLQSAIEGSNLSQEAIESAFLSTFDGDFYNSSFHTLVDGVYDQLENQDQEVKFRVSVADRAELLVEKLGGTLLSELQNLDECTPEQISNLSAEFDPLKVDCLPPTEVFELEEQIDQYVQQLDSEESFLDEVEVTEQTFFGSPNVINAYNAFNAGAILLPLIAIGLAIMMVATSKDWFKTIKNLGYLSIVIGIVMTSLYLFLRQVANINIVINEGEAGVTELANEVLTPIVQNVVGTISSSGITISVIIVGIGSSLVLVHYLFERHGHKFDDKAKPSETPEAEAKKPVEMTKKPKKIEVKDDKKEVKGKAKK